MVDNAQRRDARKRLLGNMLDDMKDIEEDRVLAIFSLKTKVSVRKAKEYLAELKAARILEVESSI